MLGVRCALAVISGACFFHAAPAAAQEKCFQRLDTGVDMTAGQHLHITATGTVRYGGSPKQVTDANGGHYTGKKFFTNVVLPTTVVCSLTGKVGGTTATDTGTLLLEGTPNDGPGFVGTS